VAGYRVGLIWLLRSLAALFLVYGAVDVFSLERMALGDPVFGSAIAAFVMAVGALALAETVAVGGAHANYSAMAECLVWVMRAAAVALFLLFLPTFVGVASSFSGTENEPTVVVQQIAFSLTTLLAQPALLLGFAEVLSLFRTADLERIKQ
jgi:hypothetical protein